MRSQRMVTFRATHHRLLAVLLFAAAALLYLLGYTNGAIGAVLVGALLEGAAWLNVIDGRPPEDRRR